MRRLLRYPVTAWKWAIGTTASSADFH